MSDKAATTEEVAKLIAACPSACADFSDKQLDALKKMADTYIALEFLGRIAGVVKSVLSYVGWAIAAYLAFKAGAVDWIRGALK